MPEIEIQLSEAIRALRMQIVEAQQEGVGEAVRFGVGPIDLEFSLVMTRDAKAQGGINIGVVSFGGSGTLSEAQTHRVKLTLTPVNAAGKPDILVGEHGIPRPGS